MDNKSCLLPRVAFWLIPSQPERAFLQNLITDLAGRFSSPEFIPHVTIYSCHRSVLQEELAIMASLAGRCPLVTLRTDGLAFRDRLTEALFVRLNSAETLEWLRETMQNELSQASSHEFDPHVSLLYKFLPASVRASLAGEIKLPMQEICFDQIWAVAIPESIHSAENLSGWQTLLSCRLASSAIVDTI